MNTPYRNTRRSGFTLTEMLVAITVLAILAGFLTPVVMNSLGTARDAAIIVEMKQMELAIESFKNDHGFYPPTFGPNGSGAAIQSPGQFQQYLNKIAPQNAESSSSFPGSSNSRLADWWINVGSQLDETTSLQFWLSGLCKNKQFPLTGGVNVDSSGGTSGVMTLCGYGDDKYSDGTDLPAGLVVERDNYYEFKNNQLEAIGGGAVATYAQPYGTSSGDLNFRYLDYKSYSTADPNVPRAYCDGLGSDGFPAYLNQKKFQLVTFGRDGMPGGTGDVTNAGNFGADNICNFVDGRLETYFNK